MSGDEDEGIPTQSDSPFNCPTRIQHPFGVDDYQTALKGCRRKGCSSQSAEFALCVKLLQGKIEIKDKEITTKVS